MDKPIYTVADLAERWSCSTDLVYDLIHRGDLKSFKIGKSAVRIRAEEVTRFENQ